jgi:hypothetical protein
MELFLRVTTEKEDDLVATPLDERGLSLIRRGVPITRPLP